LNTNLARISGLLQGRRSLEELGRIVLGELAAQVSAQYAALFVAEDAGNAPTLRRISAYGHPGTGAGEPVEDRGRQATDRAPPRCAARGDE